MQLRLGRLDVEHEEVAVALNERQRLLQPTAVDDSLVDRERDVTDQAGGASAGQLHLESGCEWGQNWTPLA